MKTLWLCILMMLEVSVVSGEEIRLEVGMSMVAANALLNNVGIDLGPALAPYYPSGERPPEGECWEVREINMVIWLHSENDTVTSIGYWSAAGFGAENERRARSMVLNTERRTVLVDPDVQGDSEKAAY